MVIKIDVHFHLEPRDTRGGGRLIYSVSKFKGAEGIVLTVSSTGETKQERDDVNFGRALPPRNADPQGTTGFKVILGVFGMAGSIFGVAQVE